MKSTFYREAETKKKLVDFIMSAQQLSLGPEVKKFEDNFSAKQGRRFAVMFNSGSSANLALIQSLLNLGRLKKGDRVGVSAVTWSTNVMPLIKLGLVPVVIDVELETLNVSPATLEPHLGKIKAMFLTNVLGLSDDIAAMQKLCREAGVILLEDNCESLGSIVDGVRLGNFGLAATFSFFVGHHISTVEGGAVATDDEEFYHMLLLVRAHGWDRNLPEDKKKDLADQYGIDDFYTRYTFYDLSYNLRPTEIIGFIGHQTLPYWDEIVSARHDNFHKFNQAIAENEELKSFEVGHMDTVSSFAMPVVARDKSIFEKYKKRFQEADVEIRPVIAGNITRQPFWGKYVSATFETPNADFIHQNAFYFPNNPELTDEEVNLLLSLLE